ncbi:helicase HerA-like domain-containing protein [Cucumibacter marinus]|uniref:helicase HerA-like domain-containing protein n=1 Tax=Cucumibacter marinus TaxID=1121252 RepID=UPI000406AE11|nr:helicase HerA-like domain-containing protein [Cucumibacter marinus]
MLTDDAVYLGTSTKPEYLLLKLANRHGLITGATGTGKTVTLQIMAEGFSRAGVPVFCADVKGDLAGISQAGDAKDFIAERLETIGFDDFEYGPTPTVFWDLFGKQGHPVRATISDMGPLLLSRLLDLNDTQEGVLNVAFKLADDEGLLILDLKDLRSLLISMDERAKEISRVYGRVSSASIGAIQRSLLVLEQQGGEHFFGERALAIEDLMRTDNSGRGLVNVLAADELMAAPRLYATFLLWLLSELFEELPEVGNPEKPRLVFFFDEAHLLFDEAPKALLDKIEQVVKLVRSKGVGVFFVTQNPLDIPDPVLAQLGNRVQHALRAYTPREAKAVRTAAETFRPNPEFSTEEAITQLGVGEALVSTLEKKGVPSIVGRTLIRPPSSRMGPISEQERQAVIGKSPVGGLYDTPLDRESAFEILEKRARDKAEEERRQREREDREREEAGRMRRSRTGYRDTTRDDRPTSRSRRSTRSRRSDTTLEAATKSLARSMARQLGNALVRGILGSLKRGR